MLQQREDGDHAAERRRFAARADQPRDQDDDLVVAQLVVTVLGADQVGDQVFLWRIAPGLGQFANPDGQFLERVIARLLDLRVREGEEAADSEQPEEVTSDEDASEDEEPTEEEEVSATDDEEKEDEEEDEGGDDEVTE